MKTVLFESVCIGVLTGGISGLLYYNIDNAVTHRINSDIQYLQNYISAAEPRAAEHIRRELTQLETLRDLSLYDKITRDFARKISGQTPTQIIMDYEKNLHHRKIVD